MLVMGKAMSDIKNNMSFALEQWGLWAVKDSGVAGYACSFGVDERAANDPLISDEDALAVDHAVGVLRRRHQAQGNAVITYYVSNCDLRGLAQKMNCSRFTAERNLKLGLSFIQGYFECRGG